ncbi:hypothetical protein F5890DRAFT_1557890 [Lentinula detonsa]|uniref:Uncharacterized protein n=1 Tax=Lentinula detonsa TaxID=2804962 RepID=A0AA38UN54_9AGAR|nr:hypothetical protein F5890DRAFT_1557890 [Lentinula detonsa]
MTLHLSPSHLLVIVFLFSSLFTILAAPPPRRTGNRDSDPVTLELCTNGLGQQKSWFLKVSPTVIFRAKQLPTGQWKAWKANYSPNLSIKCVDVGRICWTATTSTPKTKATSHDALQVIETSSSFDYVGKALRYLLETEVWVVNSDSWKNQDSYLRIYDEYLKIDPASAVLELCHYPKPDGWALKFGATTFYAEADLTGRMKIAETQSSSRTKCINLGTVNYGQLTARKAEPQVHAKLLAIEATSEFDFVGKGLKYLHDLEIWVPDLKTWIEADEDSYWNYFSGYVANID